MTKTKPNSSTAISLLVLFIIGLSIQYNGVRGVGAQGNSSVCPHNNGWTKIDSSDLSYYPVIQATAYCFKAGNNLTGHIPEGGFGQEGRCSSDNIQNCELSHWSYYISENSGEETIELEEIDPTPTPENTPSPTALPTATPAATASPTPSSSSSNNGSNTNSSNSNHQENSDNSSQGQVLGVITSQNSSPQYANAGNSLEMILQAGFISSLAMSLISLKKADRA